MHYIHADVTADGVIAIGFFLFSIGEQGINHLRCFPKNVFYLTSVFFYDIINSAV